MKQDMLTKLNTHQKKNLLGTLSYTIEKNELKMVQRPKPKFQFPETFPTHLLLGVLYIWNLGLGL